MINRTLTALFILPLLSAHNASAQSHPGITFDETVRVTSSTTASDTTPGRIHIIASGGNLRAEMTGKLPGAKKMPDEPTVMLLTDSGSKLTMLNPEQKQYMTINTVEMMEGVAKVMSAMGGKVTFDTAATKLSLDSLGPGPVIEGHPTMRYRLTSALRMTMAMMGESATLEQQMVEEIQSATDLSDLSDVNVSLNRFSRFGESMGMAPEFLNRITALQQKIRGLPIRVTKVETTKANGQPRTTTEEMTISNIKRVAVPDSLFLVPAGYTPVTLPNFPGKAQ